jgi:hypothetical protein
VFLMERRHIEGLGPEEIAAALATAFSAHC